MIKHLMCSAWNQALLVWWRRSAKHAVGFPTASLAICQDSSMVPLQHISYDRHAHVNVALLLSKILIEGPIECEPVLEVA